MNRLEPLALGGCTSYFGHPEGEQFAPGLKSLDDALRIRRDMWGAGGQSVNLARGSTGARGLERTVGMARKARVEFEGAVYHVMERGDRREAIFGDDPDRERFLLTPGEVCGRTGRAPDFSAGPGVLGGGSLGFGKRSWRF